MNWKTLFDFTGRNSRKRFWLVILASVGGYLLAGAILLATGEAPLAMVLAVPLVLAIMVAGVCNNVRRLHDLGKSGWWLLAFLALMLVVKAPAAAIPEGAAFFDLLGALLSLAFTLWVGLAKGDPGDNRFGPSPLAAPPVDAADAEPEGEELHYSGED